MSELDIRHHEAGTEYEYASIKVGGHILLISERDGDPHIYLCDHATIRVEGELKDEVTVVVGRDEFPTEVVALSELEFQERYR